MLNHLDFGNALIAAKCSRVRVAREGWNGKGMFVMYIDPYNNDQYSVIEQPGMVGTLMPYYALKTADNKLIPWNASQADMDAEDWVILD